VNNYADMRGAEWLHQSLVETELIGVSPLVEEVLKPGTPLEMVEPKRKKLQEMVMAVLAQPDPKLAAKVDKAEYFAPGLKEEANAPKVRIIVTSPKKRSSNHLPAIFTVPGGGLCILGFPELELRKHTRWAVELGCVCIASSYRLAPENKYPAAINDVHAALLWVVDNAKMLGINPSLLVAEGSSTGGHLAAALTHRLREWGGPKLCAQLLQFPILDDRMAMPSSNIFFEQVWLPNAEQMSWMAWLGDKYVRADTPPDAVPGHARDFHGLPPAIIHGAENDHGRDDVIRYASGLMQAGVYCDLHIWGGTYHGFPSMQPEAEISRRYSDFVIMQLKDALTGKLSRR
jgi:acetyl esterase/lipase